MRALPTDATAPERKAALDQLAAAEAEFLTAQQALFMGTAGSGYVLFKKAVISAGSLVIGIILALLLKLQLFKSAGLGGMNMGVDSFLTGVMIGAGPGPIHALINLLTEVKNVAAGVADAARGTGLQKATLAVQSTPSGTRAISSARQGVEAAALLSPRRS